MKHLYFSVVFLFLVSLSCFSQDTISIKLNASATGKTIASDFAGLSFEKSSLNKAIFSSRSDTLIRIFQTLGIRSLRMGGNSVDKDTLSTIATKTHFTKSALDSLFLFARQAGCRIFIGMNCGGNNNPSLAAKEASYIVQKYNSELVGFEVGNEPDLYHSNGFRPSTYSLANYESDYQQYYDSIKHYQPSAAFTGPASAGSYNTFTLPFCRHFGSKISMLTQHYYVGKANAETVHKQIVTLLSAAKLNSISTEVKALVSCADSSKISFRMGECNSFYNGGQWGVSDAFASALWALDYMYKLASDGCSGVNFHGGLSGPYTVISKKKNIYSVRPIAYGILAFQIGSKGRFISAKVTNNNINLNSYSVIDSSKNIYCTIINKDTLQNAVIKLDAGSSAYTSAEYVRLSSPSLGDTITVSLGEQIVNSVGTCPALTWQSVAVSANKTQISIPAGSAVVLRFNYNPDTSLANYNEKDIQRLNLFPNPSSDKVTLTTILSVPAVMTIYNLQGQTLLQEQVQQEKTDIDINGLAKGVYVLSISNNNEKEVAKLIKK
jgi:hypothetical protein